MTIRKTLIVVASLGMTFSVGLATSVLLQAGGPSQKDPEDLERLQTSFAKRRADTLKSTSAWYETQLQKLQAKYKEKDNVIGLESVENELNLLRENMVHENAAGFRAALLAGPWSWSSDPNVNGVKMTFRETPYVSHIGMGGDWKVTAARQVTIAPPGEPKIVLEFDEKVTEYRQTGGKTTGKRWK
jgi:hypothetical protein